LGPHVGCALAVTEMRMSSAVKLMITSQVPRAASELKIEQVYSEYSL
jgi:hypothetical protein